MAGRAAAPPAWPRSPRRSRSSPASCSPSRSSPRRASPRSSRTPTRSWRRSGSSSAGCPTRWSCCKDAGCDIDGERVRFPRGLARQLVQATAPREFDQYARNPANTVHLGGTATVLAPAYGSPFVRDLDGGRRYGTIEDFRNFVKLAYATPFLHHSGGTVCEPVDLPVNKRHYDMVYAHMKYSDKPFMGSVTHPLRARDTVDMAQDPVRRRRARGAHLHPQPVQREQPARVGLDHARRGEGLRRGEPGRDHDPVHPGGGDESGDRPPAPRPRRWPRRWPAWPTCSSFVPARPSCSARSPRRCRCSRARRRSARPSPRSCCTRWPRAPAASACRSAAAGR